MSRPAKPAKKLAKKKQAAVKESPLSEIERFFIEGHLDDMTVEDMAAKLGRSDLSGYPVREHYHKAYAEKPKPNNGPPAAGDLLARDKKRGVVTMTKEASLRAEEERREKPSTMPSRFADRIGKAKP